MKTRFMHPLLTGMVAVAAVLPVGALANPHKGGAAPAKAASMKCPVCKMTMLGKPSKGAPSRVHVGRHYFYCCAACGFKGDAAPRHHGKKPAAPRHHGKKPGRHMGHHHAM